jgi:apolipoprotein N-acyltransferase
VGGVVLLDDVSGYSPLSSTSRPCPWLTYAVVAAIFAYLYFANNAIQRWVKEGRLDEGSILYWLLIVAFLIPPIEVLLYSLSTLPQ